MRRSTLAMVVLLAGATASSVFAAAGLWLINLVLLPMMWFAFIWLLIEDFAATH